MTKKTGLLLPRSVLYPSINFDLLGGMRAGLEANESTDIQVVTDNIGVGSNDQQIYNSCEKMLMDGCAVVAGYVNPNTALKLQSLFASANAVFICLDSGYQFMQPNPQVLPNVIFVSLQGTLCCRAAATLATRAGFTSFAFTSSFLDAGYRSCYTYSRALTEEGAEVVFNHVTTLKRKEFTIEPLTTFLNHEPQHAVLAAFCGDMLQDFCEQAAKTQNFTGHLFVSPFMLEESWLEKSDYPGVDMHGAVTWARDLDNDANASFRKAMETQGRGQNVFSVLGYEAGMIINTIFQKEKQGAEAVNELKGTTYESPRGTVLIDAETNQSLPPVYYVKAIRNEQNGKCKLQIMGVTGNAHEQWELLQEDISSLGEESTNWLNTYPCIES